MGRALDVERWQKFARSRLAGRSVVAAARDAGLSYTVAQKAASQFAKGIETGDMRNQVRIIGDLYRLEGRADGTIVPDIQHSDPAKRALGDFLYFRRRYFGMVEDPWAKEASDAVLRYLASPDKEYVVFNAPPGIGKSQLFSHDLLLWLICRDRSIRILFGSASEARAKDYVSALRRTLERTDIFMADDNDKKRGLAYDAEATLVADFGSFVPKRGERWRAEAFVVAQNDGRTLADKEATVTAFGMDSKSLGHRVDFVMWDDLVNDQNTMSPITNGRLKSWWDKEAEKRLEPFGVLVLQGQRMGPTDLYRHCLDKLAYVPEDDEIYEEEVDVLQAALNGDTAIPVPVRDGLARKYHHVRFVAHDDAKCTGDHDPRKTIPWPVGCLLSPRRLTYRDLMTEKRTDLTSFLTVYQQEDTAPGLALVEKQWIDGGIDSSGVQCLEAWDDRRLGEVPPLTGLVSYMTCDPSGANRWSVQWWVYHPPSEQRFLVDIVNRKLRAPDFLEGTPGVNGGWQFAGVAEDFVAASRLTAAPIKTLVLEINTLQRWLTQYAFADAWRRHHGVRLMPHDTKNNKTDKVRGVEMLGRLYQNGKVRLPGSRSDYTRVRVQESIVSELITWPHGGTSDNVMSEWFGEYQLPNLIRAETREAGTPAKRPEWLRGTRRPPSYRTPTRHLEAV